MACDDPELFLDKKWRTRAKKHAHHHHYTFDEEDDPSPNPNFSSSSSSKTASSSTNFLRSFSLKNPKTSSSSSLSKASSSPPFRRSSSTCHHHSPTPEEDSPPASIRGLSRKGSAFTKKCTSLAREQKARFYIMRRCVSMLVRWSKHRE